MTPKVWTVQVEIRLRNTIGMHIQLYVWTKNLDIRQFQLLLGRMRRIFWEPLEEKP